MKKNALKTLALLLAAVFVLGSFAGCSQPAQEPSAPPESEAPVTGGDDTPAEPVTITFWHTYSDSEEAQLLDVVLPLWNELHPEITVEAVRQDSRQYHEMIVTSFGTGASPDVARVDIANIAAYAAQGGLVALSDYPDFAEISADYMDAPLSTNLYQGKYYGLPLDTNCKAAVVNLNVLAELGLDAVPETLEELIEAASGRGSYTINVSGVGDWDMYPYFWLFGGVDGSVDAWDGINSEYAMFFEGPWYFGSYEDSEAKGIVAATIPTYNGKSASVVGGENVAVFSTSENPDAAYEFAKFLTSAEAQLALLQAGQLPILKSLVDSDEVQSNPVWSVYMAQMESAKARIPSPNNSNIQQIWSDMVTNIFVSGADITTELQNAAALIDEQLA